MSKLRTFLLKLRLLLPKLKLSVQAEASSAQTETFYVQSETSAQDEVSFAQTQAFFFVLPKLRLHLPMLLPTESSFTQDKFLSVQTKVLPMLRLYLLQMWLLLPSTEASSQSEALTALPSKLKPLLKLRPPSCTHGLLPKLRFLPPNLRPSVHAEASFVNIDASSSQSKAFTAHVKAPSYLAMVYLSKLSHKLGSSVQTSVLPQICRSMLESRCYVVGYQPPDERLRVR